RHRGRAGADGAHRRAQRLRAQRGRHPGAALALHCPPDYKIALYEPPPPVGRHPPAHRLPRYEQEMAEGRTAAALVTVARGTGDDSAMLKLPRAILVPLLSLAMRAQARQASGDEVPLRDLVPTMHYDARLVRDAVGLIDA